MRRAARADGNQAELVKLMRQMGASWQHTHTIPGALDGILGFRGVDVRVEIKDGSQSPSRRALTDAEKKTINEWKGSKPVIIETKDDVVALLAKLAQLAKSK